MIAKDARGRVPPDPFGVLFVPAVGFTIPAAPPLGHRRIASDSLAQRPDRQPFEFCVSCCRLAFALCLLTRYRRRRLLLDGTYYPVSHRNDGELHVNYAVLRCDVQQILRRRRHFLTHNLLRYGDIAGRYSFRARRNTYHFMAGR